MGIFPYLFHCAPDPVLDKDPLRVPAEQWMDIKVERTMLGGNWVYEP
jgi:predicted amidohydrolase YtcJ